MNLQQYQGPISRRGDLLTATVGGGHAGAGVNPSDHANAVGNLGLNVETNPTVVHDDEGRAVYFPRGDGLYRPAHFEVVSSMRRDPDVYPNAYSFRLKFQKPLRYVFAIEVLEINVPNVETTAPANREFLLLNGLVTEQGGNFSFRPQDSIPKDRSFHTMLIHNADDRDLTDNNRSVESVAAKDLFPLDDYALGRYKYDATAPFQYWNRSGWHRKTWFPTPLARLDFLDFSMLDTTGVPYDFAEGDEWSATLQIFSKQ